MISGCVCDIYPQMITTNDTLSFIGRAHAGQTDKGGNPYTDHLKRVWQKTCQKLDVYPHLSLEERFAVENAALLHDVLEDTSTTSDDLANMGYSARVISLVMGLSRPEGEDRPTYQEWIMSIAQSGDLGLILIKLADNEDNSDPVRIAQLPPEQQGITNRYSRARKTLLDGLARLS